jgi:hypothetical protein
MRFASTLARRAVGAALLALLVTACDADDAVSPAGTINGVRYSASLELIANELYPNKPPAFFNVVVRLTNTRAVPLSRSYPVDCPVLLTLERVSDGLMVYDESARPCAPTPIAALDIPTDGSTTLVSGLRMFATLRASAVPVGSYRVKATLRTEGTRPVELLAGTLTIAAE